MVLYTTVRHPNAHRIRTYKEEAIDGSSSFYIRGKCKQTQNCCLVWPIQHLRCQIKPLRLTTQDGGR
jgi:hypothetical protein